MKTVAELYREERKKGYKSLPAIAAARAKVRWDRAGGGIVAFDYYGKPYDSTIDVPVQGSVRLVIAEDQYPDVLDYECCEDVDTQHRNCEHKSEDRNRKCPYDAPCYHKCRDIQRANRDGVHGIIAQYRNCYLEPDVWITVDSVWGFIGMDWQDSGYDADMMAIALDAMANAAGEEI